MGLVDGHKAFQWLTLVIAFIFVLLRLYVRFPFPSTRSKIKSSLFSLDCLSDILVVCAWLFYLEQCIIDIILAGTDFFDDIWEDDVPLPTRSLVLKLWAIENLTYLHCMYAVKTSLLILYHQSLPRATAYKDWRWLKRGLVVVDVTVAAGWIVYFVTGFADCPPVSRSWNPDPEKFCPFFNLRWYIWTVYGWHCVTDILVYLFPFFFIGTLHKSMGAKLGLAVTFTVGFLSVCSALVLQLGYVIELPNDKIFFLNDLEQMCAIIAGCLPALRALFEARRRLPRTVTEVPEAVLEGVEGPPVAESVSDKSTSAIEKGPPARAVLAEARNHSDWMRDVMVREHLTRAEMTSIQEDEALERLRRISSPLGNRNNG